jgi:hypothetical protein
VTEAISQAESVGNPSPLRVEHALTADMADGQPLPPFIEDRIVWHLVRRADGRTLWRRIFLSPSLVTAGARSRDQTRAP